MILRNYDAVRDRAPVIRLWTEIGWLERGQEEALDLLIGRGGAFVADMNDEAECLVLTTPGTLRYQEEELPFGVVSAVMTSRIARKRGLAGRLCARAIADLVASGYPLVGLGIFDQGYYNRLGFGSGGYEHFVAFDPSQLAVDVRPRAPRRVTNADWAAVHASRLARVLGHGGVSLLPPAASRAAMMRGADDFGLGYYDGPHGELTHHFWVKVENAQHGPYLVLWMSYQNPAQFQELMGLLRDLGDQVHLIVMTEPPLVQMQDVIREPFRHRLITERSPFATGIRAAASWQVRICDLAGCLARTHLEADPLRFNLSLGDPIERFLDEAGPWRGVAGEYVVTLGPQSCAERGTDHTLPTLTTSVNAFSRLWLGVRPAPSLAFTDQLAGPPDLLQRLGRTLRLPQPQPGWEF